MAMETEAAKKARTDEAALTLSEEMYKCVHCGLCLDACPTYDELGLETESSRGRIAFMKAVGEGRLPMSRRVAAHWESCFQCLACQAVCPSAVPLGSLMAQARTLAVEAVGVPRELQEVFESTFRYGNPLGQSPRRRTEWARGLGVPVPEISRSRKRVDVLWFVGCYPSYHPRVQKVARALAEILNALDINFGITREEQCSGDSLRLAGEIGLFEYLVEHNMEAFGKLQFKELLTVDPHAYNALKNEYPKYGLSHQVRHYSEFLVERLDALKALLTNPMDVTVTYHDPCYLGRGNGVYEEPRRLLQAIPGLTLVEMPRNRENGFCCGGGAGGMWLDIEAAQHYSERLSEKRVEEAASVGAEVLAVACPYDLLRFEDAVKTKGLEGKLVVKDSLELLVEATGR